MKVRHSLYLGCDLTLHQEDVAVVLLELADALSPASAPETSLRCSMSNVAMRNAARDRVFRPRIEQVMRRAVHRLQRKVVLAGLLLSTRNMFSWYCPNDPTAPTGPC